MIQYFAIDNYSMKCRLYPNKEQAQYIDNCLKGIKALSNMINYDMRNSFMWTNESKDKETGEIIHWADFTKAFSKESLDYYRDKNEYINYLPGAALSSSVYGLCHDFKMSAEKPNKCPVEKWGETYIDKDTGQKKRMGVSFYSKTKPPKSFSYKVSVSKLITYKNRNVLGIKLGNKKYKFDSYVKIRGWNQNIKFDEDHEIDFRQWISDNAKKESIRIRISKDNCGDYYIIFLFPKVYKPMKVLEEREDCRGIDVGEKTLVTISDGTKIDNLYDYNTRIMDEKSTIDFYNRKLSRSEGWRNIDFRNRHKSDKELQPSKNYQRLDLKHKKLNRKIQRQRVHYYNVISAKLATSYNVLGIEGLNVRDMKFVKDKNESKKQDK